MKRLLAVFLCILLLGGAMPARADFHYSEISKMTGGTLMAMMKVLGPFGGKSSNLSKPITTEVSLKGNKLRRESSDGRIHITDLDGRRFIEIDAKKKTYSEMTFEEMKAAMKKAQEDAKKKMEENPKHANAKMNVKVSVTAGEGTREILGKTTHEVKARIEMEAEATGNPEAARRSAQGGSIVTTSDAWVAPGIPGHDELLRFYQRMAKEIDWVPPSSIQIDPQVSKSMAELQKNQGAFKGMPLLSYVSMGMEGAAGAPAASTPEPKHSSSSRESVPTTPGGAAIKGLGGLFGKHKQKEKEKEEAEAQDSKNPPPPSTPGALMELTVEVTSFSSDSLPASLFTVPAGYTRVEASADAITGTPSHKH
ncbi:MAG: hypothetical protein LAN71_12955 [Acidobacteriia bacterium]|nr:hypothetical protein [Terriglobia bacterium]